jgi:hypothetical protein
MWLRLEVCCHCPPEVCYLHFCGFHKPLMFTIGLTCGCIGVYDDVGVDVGFHPMTQGEPSTVFGDDDEE